MRSDPLMEQVTGILVRAQVPFEFHEDGDEIGVSTDETVVFMRPHELGGVPFLRLEVDLALDIEMTREVAAGIYVWLNQRNAEERLARFALHDAPRQEGEIQRAWVSAEWELSAERLDGPSLLFSMSALTSRAGPLSGDLTQLFGGLTPLQLRNECRALNENDHDD